MALPEWFVFLLFLAWGVLSLVSAQARYRRWLKYQRQSWLIADAIFRAFLAIAFCMGALIVGPRPIDDFEWLRPISRWFWLAGFVPFVVGVFLDWHNLGEIEHERSKAGWIRSP